MRAVSDRWRVLQTALGSRRYALADISKLVLAAVAALYLYWYGRSMSLLELALCGIVVVLGFLFWVTLDYSLKLTRKIADGRVKIAALRNEGVKIRNRGAREVIDADSWAAWSGDALSWNEKVIRELREISEADALWFSVLDVVPPPRIDPANSPSFPEDRHAFSKLYREHDARLARLGDMIRELWKST